MRRKINECIIRNNELIESLHIHIQNIQEIDPLIAYFAIDAQRELMVESIWLKEEKRKIDEKTTSA